MSWPSCDCTTTREQSIGPLRPSSLSVTFTVNGIVSPKLNIPPSGGCWIVTSGLVLPTVMSCTASAVSSSGPVTVSRAVCSPLAVYVCEGAASVESVVPSPSKSQA